MVPTSVVVRVEDCKMLEGPSGGIEGTVCCMVEKYHRNNLGGTTFDLERNSFVRLSMAGRGNCQIHSEETYLGVYVE